MITIYHLDNSRSERIVWLMEELGLPYEQKTFLRDQGMAPAEMKAIHPRGKAPLIRDGEQAIMESGAIVEYILQRYGNGRLVPPVASADYVHYLEFMHFAEGSLMSGLLNEFMLRMIGGDKAEESPGVQGLAARNHATLTFLDNTLAKAPYFAGSEFTAADIMMEFCFIFKQRYMKQDLSAYPHIAAWLERVHARPAYQRMMAVAAPQVVR